MHRSAQRTNPPTCIHLHGVCTRVSSCSPEGMRAMDEGHFLDYHQVQLML